MTSDDTPLSYTYYVYVEDIRHDICCMYNTSMTSRLMTSDDTPLSHTY